MTLIKIDEVLKSQGKTRYWLAKETKTTYQNMVNLIEGKTTSAKFDLLEKICLALECKLDDIIEFIDTSKGSIVKEDKIDNIFNDNFWHD